MHPGLAQSSLLNSVQLKLPGKLMQKAARAAPPPTISRHQRRPVVEGGMLDIAKFWIVFSSVYQ